MKKLIIILMLSVIVNASDGADMMYGALNKIKEIIPTSSSDDVQREILIQYYKGSLLYCSSETDRAMIKAEDKWLYIREKKIFVNKQMKQFFYLKECHE